MKKLFVSALLFACLLAHSQVGIGTTSPQATLDVTGSPAVTTVMDGIIPPRLTTAQLSAKTYTAAQNGALVYVTDVTQGADQASNINGFGLYTFDANSLKWKLASGGGGGSTNPTITGLTCASATTTGNIIAGQAVSGATLTVPYTGGSGAAYPAGTAVTASGGTVTGLTLTLQAGNLANGAGSLVYTISGTPSGVGNSVFSLAFGGQVCNNATVTASAAPSISSLTCTATQSGTLYVGTAASGVTFTVPYTGGNGSAYNAGTGITSSGVTGLTATLVAGTLATGSGTLTYNVTGTPSGSGLATFNLSFNGANCAGAGVNVMNSGSSSALVDNFSFGGQGGQESFAVCSDGSVMSQGANPNGELGSGNGANTGNGSLTAYNMVGFNSTNQATAVAGASESTYILRADGTLWATGRGANGELGNNATGSSLFPVQVSGVGGSGYLTDVTKIGTGEHVAFAIKSDGTAYGWGRNSWGNLGDGTTNDTSSPVQVKGVGGSGFLTGVTQITSALSGGLHTCAVRNDGYVFCWGDNGWGQLGDATTVSSSTPRQVRGQFGIGNLSNVKAVAVNEQTSAAVLNDGTVYAWGNNSTGELGQNTSSGSNSTPLQVKGVGGTGFLTGIVDIKSYQNGFIVLKSDGTVYGWGDNFYSETGDNTFTQRNVPVQTKGVGGVGFLTGIVAISGGFRNVGALGSNGVIYGWGDNGNASLAPTANATRIMTPVALTNFCTVQ